MSIYTATANEICLLVEKKLKRQLGFTRHFDSYDYYHRYLEESKLEKNQFIKAKGVTLGSEIFSDIEYRCGLNLKKISSSPFIVASVVKATTFACKTIYKDLELKKTKFNPDNHTKFIQEFADYISKEIAVFIVDDYMPYYKGRTLYQSINPKNDFVPTKRRKSF